MKLFCFQDTVSDIHLNGVLPESDSPSQPLKVREQQTAAAEQSLELELQPEAEATTIRGPPNEKLPGEHGNPPYFSRVIQSIFEVSIHSCDNVIYSIDYYRWLEVKFGEPSVNVALLITD